MVTLLIRTLALAAAVIVLNFGLPRLLPGDPLDALAAAESESGASPLSADARQALRAFYHLDAPLPEQFAAYLGGLAHGDLGVSIARKTTVATLIGQRLPWTLGLVGSAMLTASAGGTLLGLLAAWRGGRWDNALLSVATVIEALPEFLVGVGLLLVFAATIPLFPLSGGRTLFATGPPAVLDVVWHLALPYLTLVLGSFAAFVLVARGACRSAARATYVTTARAKGLPDRRVLLGHVLPNALAPILTLLGLRLGSVVGGAIVVERVFGVPGVGQLSFEAVQARDYPVLQALFLLSGLGVIGATFLIETSYRLVLPHARR